MNRRLAKHASDVLLMFLHVQSKDSGIVAMIEHGSVEMNQRVISSEDIRTINTGSRPLLAPEMISKPAQMRPEYHHHYLSRG